MPAGELVSHYRLLEPLGSGAMGEVWLAEDTQLPRRVAIKLLPQSLAHDREGVERLVREAQATASIDHPAVATVYEAGELDGKPYLVMKYFEGETLGQRLERGPLPVSEALALATVVADALAEVHALGIVHRDLKPSNIMLSPRGPKILDFGLAAVKALPHMTTPGATLGTPVTMAPEQVNGLPPDNRSDLWALGVILYQALTGRLPFTGGDYGALFQQILNHAPERPETLRPEVESDLGYIVMKLLRKEPAQRYGRAEDVLADLGACDQRLTGASMQETVTFPAAQSAHPQTPRLAVLPFEMLSVDPDDAYLATGLVEDLIVDLSRVERLRVASRGEVAPYADRTVPPRTLARELSADYVLTGSVRRHDNRARISAQLARCSDGHLLWAERFDRTLEDLFGVQEEVSRSIVGALQVVVAPSEQEMLGRAPAKNTEAYTLYLKSRELIDRSRESNLRAERLLEQALALDPDFALAHAALGECYASRGLRWWSGLEVAEPALACARRALELEPGLPDALWVELAVRRLEGDPEKVLEAIGKLLAVNPDHPQALEWTGWSYLALGKPEEALPVLARLTHKTMGLSFLSNCYEMLGRDDDALNTLRQMRELLVDTLRRDPEAIHERSLLGVTLARLGEPEAAVEQAERAVALDPEDGRMRYNAACTYAITGQCKSALKHLKTATSRLASFISDWPRHDPDLANLHEHPEFVEMFGSAADGQA